MDTAKPGPSGQTLLPALPALSRSELAEEILRTTPDLARQILKMHDESNSDSEKTPELTSEQMQATLLNSFGRIRKT